MDLLPEEKPKPSLLRPVFDMNLSDVYSNRVKKTSVSSLGVGGSFPTIEKDPTINKLERDVMSQMASLMPKETIATVINSPSVKILTPEEAIKELIELEKSQIMS
jgi:hypothetical protein